MCYYNKIGRSITIVYALRCILKNAGTKTEKAFIERTMGELDQRKDDFKKMCKLLAKYDAYEHTLAMAAGYSDKARKCLMGFGLSPARGAMLDAVNFALSRAY